eukprot:726270-Rhodomonas_salina.3
MQVCSDINTERKAPAGLLRISLYYCARGICSRTQQLLHSTLRLSSLTCTSLRSVSSRRSNTTSCGLTDLDKTTTPNKDANGS